MNFRDCLRAAVTLGSVSVRLGTLVWPKDPSSSLLRTFELRFLPNGCNNAVVAGLLYGKIKAD